MSFLQMRAVVFPTIPALRLFLKKILQNVLLHLEIMINLQWHIQKDQIE